MKIAIDLDGTCNRYSNFLSLLTNCQKDNATIYIVTNRDKSDVSVKETKKELNDINICYDYLIVTDKKANYIMENNIEVIFENEDENILDLPSSIAVFKVREECNFDYNIKRWVGNSKTVRMI